MPGDLKVYYFVNSGSEANDLAILMARAYTGNYDIIALRNAYHGGNSSGMSPRPLPMPRGMTCTCLAPRAVTRNVTVPSECSLGY